MDSLKKGTEDTGICSSDLYKNIPRPVRFDGGS